MQGGYRSVLLRFFFFSCGHKLCCLFNPDQWVYVYVFVCKGLAWGLCGLWVFDGPKLEVQQKLGWPSTPQTFLIPACAHALDSVKTGISKGWVSRFMSTISHNVWPENMRKNVRSNVFCWGYVDMTDASGFNGVEQCEKCLSRCNSKVHHATFIWIVFSLYFSSFSVALFLVVSHFVPNSVLFMFCFCFMPKRAVVSQRILLFLFISFAPKHKVYMLLFIR